MKSIRSSRITQIMKLTMTFPFLVYGSLFAMQSAYDPLPQYGFVGFNNATCAMSTATEQITLWTAVPFGMGYPASQYQCAGSYRVINNTTGTGDCSGSFSAPSSPTSAHVFTDAIGNINIGHLTGTFIAAATPITTTCSTALNDLVTISLFIICSLPNGGALDTLITGTAATCTVGA